MTEPSRSNWLDLPRVLGEMSSRKKKPHVLYYEIAPTGPLHAGILRTLLKLQETCIAARENGYESTSILGLADKVALKHQAHFPDYDRFIGGQLIDIPAPATGLHSYFDFFCQDVYRTIEKYKIQVDRYVRTSELSRSDEMKGLVNILYEKQEAIRNILARSQRRSPSLFYPKCDVCGKMYHSSLTYFDDAGCGEYTCSSCGHQGKCSVLFNNGAFAFKLQLALIWKLLDVDFYFAGVDHVDAANVALEISKVLSAPHLTIPCIVNLTIADGKEVAHKSLGNFRPVSELNDQQADELVRILRRTGVKTLLVLPQGLRPK